MRHQHPMRFGARLREGGGVDFALWAPGAQTVELVLHNPPPQQQRQDGHGTATPDVQQALHGPEGHATTADDACCEVFLPVRSHADGWHDASVPGVRPGARYGWRINGEITVPDPASRFNPDGVHALSEVIDPTAFDWGDDDEWTGRPWSQAVMYELHVGTFTPEGTYAAAQAKLPELARLGITAIQLMPIAAFPGRFGWGYDGVLPFAPHPAYGTPDDLKRFIRAAHALRLMVMLDVVYNHFGPDGNYLPVYAPAFFTERHRTPWGPAVNFDQPGSEVVRRFFTDNALYWLREYRFDGLRLDAVHAMLDDTQPDIMTELSHAVRQAFPDRHVHLVLENDSNDPARLAPPATPGRFDGQWNGDFHHTLHVLMTGEREGYYAEYVDDPVAQLQRCLTDGLYWQGGPHNAEGAEPRRPSQATVPLGTMVNFLQNHDQVGNRAFGERLVTLVDEGPLRLATALQLLSPTPPLLMMGEEWGASTPFLYFADWQGPLRQAVTEGRRREFSHFSVFSNPEARERIPDPCSETTFQASKLDWAAFERAPSQRWHALYAQLLARRHADLTPMLPDLLGDVHRCIRLGPHALAVAWQFREGVRLTACVNLGPDELRLDDAQVPSWVLAEAPSWHEEGEVEPRRLGPWSGRWWWMRTEPGIRPASGTTEGGLPPDATTPPALGTGDQAWPPSPTAKDR